MHKSVRFSDQCGIILHGRVQSLHFERVSTEHQLGLFDHLVSSAGPTALLPGLPQAAHDVVQVRLGHVRHVVRQLQLVRHRVAVLARQRPHHRAAHPLQ